MRPGLSLILAAGVAASCVFMSGCGSIGAAAGAAAGVSTGVVTSNPAIGFGVGIAVQAATDEAIQRLMKRLHTDQQIAIATTVGDLPIGDTKPWRVKHGLPVENGHGDVRVLREFSSALATCREFAFSVADGDKPDAHQDWFLAQACKGNDSGGWKWASAEPAVERWGNLQ
ncbi:hypothetical protein M0D69_00930 [Caballeronia sp. SEWSISQ10-4 2]|uniref:hypothetical protein n=1 Tax=Caballeronia sp. SEWSISQ10-4 2 TaxID=2937438 RepID=UPI00265702EA|nr:hypothetical protein [Caballeronia sp. SEWSISQ10-4 2]MDN7176607.1 hypothetical protein [Caballeronia sp. SEWSISQ10-4 2]